MDRLAWFEAASRASLSFFEVRRTILGAFESLFVNFFVGHSSLMASFLSSFGVDFDRFSSRNLVRKSISVQSNPSTPFSQNYAKLTFFAIDTKKGEIRLQKVQMQGLPRRQPQLKTHGNPKVQRHHRGKLHTPKIAKIHSPPPYEPLTPLF